MKAPAPDVTIVIVNWNVGDLLLDCLRSLASSNGNIQTELIVVDNASVDNSVELVRQEFPSVILLTNAENVGFARANNLAIQQARGRYVLLLNPDTVVFPTTVEDLVWFMDNTPEAGVVGCKQIYVDGTWQSTCHRMITLKREAIVALGLSKLFPWWVDYGDLPLKAIKPFPVDWVGGACLMIRHEMVLRIGLLDEHIFMYAEDADLCRRVRNLGYLVYYLPDVHIVHHRGQSSSQFSRLPTPPNASKLLRQYAGKQYVIRKHSGNLSASFYSVVIVLEIVRKLIQDLLTSLLSLLGLRSVSASDWNKYLFVLRTILAGSILDHDQARR